MKRPFALTSFGLPHTMGYLRTHTGERHPSPLDLIGLMDRASTEALAGIEAPLPVPFDSGALKTALDERGLRMIPDSGGLLDTSLDALEDFLRNAAALNAPVVRVTLSPILCGDRRSLGRPWEEHLDALGERLRSVLPLAADLGVTIAVENHQDATSDDLLGLAGRVDSHPAFGVTLDTGNALAVGEDPVEYARRVAPLVRHAHLKDYTIHFAPEGYRLVRCAAGDGVIDFPAILAVLNETGSPLLPGIEIAAQATRTIPILDAGWWACYPDRQFARLIPALALLWQKGQPAHLPYSSAWEQGKDTATVSAEEWNLVERSIEYFRRLEIIPSAVNSRRPIPCPVP